MIILRIGGRAMARCELFCAPNAARIFQSHGRGKPRNAAMSHAGNPELNPRNGDRSPPLIPVERISRLLRALLAMCECPPPPDHGFVPSPTDAAWMGAVSGVFGSDGDEDFGVPCWSVRRVAVPVRGCGRAGDW